MHTLSSLSPATTSSTRRATSTVNCIASFAPRPSPCIAVIPPGSSRGYRLHQISYHILYQARHDGNFSHLIMPKFPKPFANRRKSTANALEELAAANPPLVEPSFKVFERNPSPGAFNGGVKLMRPASTSIRPATNSYRDDNIFDGISAHRSVAQHRSGPGASMLTCDSGSGGSHANSTTDNSSARLSAASTAPSSMEAANEEWRSPHDKPNNETPKAPASKSSSSTFSLKHAGRSLSWGRMNKAVVPSPSPTKEVAPPPMAEEDDDSGRPRAVTGSSYASTAVPTKMDRSSLRLSVGGDFSNMFGGDGDNGTSSESPVSYVLLPTSESR